MPTNPCQIMGKLDQKIDWKNLQKHLTDKLWLINRPNQHLFDNENKSKEISFSPSARHQPKKNGPITCCMSTFGQCTGMSTLRLKAFALRVRRAGTLFFLRKGGHRDVGLMSIVMAYGERNVPMQLRIEPTLTHKPSRYVSRMFQSQGLRKVSEGFLPSWSQHGHNYFY